MWVCGKSHVGLWEKSYQFVGKIMSVCGKIMSVCGKNSLVRKLNQKIPAHTPRKKIRDYLRIFAKVHTASHNVYLKENSLKLKTACGIRLCGVLLTAESDTTVFC